MSAFKKPYGPAMEKLREETNAGKIKLPTTFDELAELIDCSIYGQTQDLQQERAEKLRPKKNPTHRSVVIEAMHDFRFEGSSIETFLEADIDGITVEPMDNMPMSDKRKKYRVICEAISPHAPDTGKVKSLGTLYDWWSEAAKRR